MSTAPNGTRSPLDAFAAELAADVGRIERELRLQMAALTAEVREEVAALRTARAEAELRTLNAEHALADKIWSLVAEAAREAVKAVPMPVPVDGHTPTAEDLAPLVEAAVAALPAAEPGLPGPPGRDGTSITGPPGPEGPPGRLPAVTAWREAVHYTADVVSHAGGTWQALRDTAREPPDGDWLPLALPGQNGADGRDGAEGRGFVVCGNWTGAKAYPAMSVVMRDGASYVAREDNPGTCPGDGWQLLAGHGKRGDRGERGERGAAGPPGAGLVDASVDREGMLTLVSADGSRITCDFYPLFARVE